MAQPQVTLLSELEHVRDELDRVIHDLQLGHPRARQPQRAHDVFVDRVEDLATRMRSAVRGSRCRPTAAPIWTNGAGQAAW